MKNVEEKIKPRPTAPGPEMEVNHEVMDGQVAPSWRQSNFYWSFLINLVFVLRISVWQCFCFFLWDYFGKNNLLNLTRGRACSAGFCETRYAACRTVAAEYSLIYLMEPNKLPDTQHLRVVPCRSGV